MATILIVDDHPTNRAFLSKLLGEGGHCLLEAADGMEALAAVKAERPDLVIIDILMPTMDGARFVRHLRADPSIADTRVIFCTAHYHEPEAQALARACGVSIVLTKPSEPEQVLGTVETALGISQPPSSPPTRAETDRENLHLPTEQLTENARQLQRANCRLKALMSFCLELGSERDPQRLLQNFCHAARKLAGARYAVAGIVNGDGSTLRYFFTSGMDAETVIHLGAPDPTQGGIVAVLRESRCLRLQNAGEDPVALGFPSRYPPIHAWLGVPIVSPGQVYGWLDLTDKLGADAFSAEDERLVGILATQVGQIYEKGSLYTELLKRTSQLEQEVAERKKTEESLAERSRLAFLVGEVGVVLTQGSTLQVILDRSARALVQHLDAAFARIWTLNEAGDILELQASAGMYTHLDGPHCRVPVGKFKIGLIAQERKPHLTNDVRNDPRVGDPDWAIREGMVAFAGYPLLGGGAPGRCHGPVRAAAAHGHDLAGDGCGGRSDRSEHRESAVFESNALGPAAPAKRRRLQPSRALHLGG